MDVSTQTEMEDLSKMQDDLEKVIENDNNSIVTSNPESSDAHEPQTIREKLDHIIHSHRFQVGVIVLVVLDCVMVIAELLFDLEIVKLGESHHFIPKIFHFASLTILCVFLIETGVRLYVLRLSFFKHKLEVFDAIVVIVSFILDVVFINNEDATTGIGFLIILRLWRVTRIVNGIVLSVKKQAEQTIEKEKHLREACEKELLKFRKYSTAQEAEIEKLQGLLRKHNINFTVRKLRRPTCNVEIEVAAEVSHETKTSGDKGDQKHDSNESGLVGIQAENRAYQANVV